MEYVVTPLTDIICSIIETEGAITLEQYMDLVLHHPDHGYYRQGNPLGIDGDFITSPDASSIFGEMIGAWCVDAWGRIGKPSSFILLELGPGQGTLMQAALHFTQNCQDFHQGMLLYMLESNVTLRAIQQEKLSYFKPTHIERINDLPTLPIIIIANEFFDTIPIRQFVRTLFGWRERLVTFKNGGFSFILSRTTRLPRSTLKSKAIKEIRRGCFFETSSQTHEIMKLITSHIAGYGGAGLIIDYGYRFPPKEGTLDALYRHKFVDIFTTPGKVDVTAGVDFSMLTAIAQQEKLRVEDVVKQDVFLRKMGIIDRADAIRNSLPAPKKFLVGRSLDYLMSQSKMGKYYVLEFMRDLQK